MITIDNVEYTSLLEALNDQRIFSIRESKDGIFTIHEECDHYFRVHLTRDELRQLGQEIIDLANHRVARP